MKTRLYLCAIQLVMYFVIGCGGVAPIPQIPLGLNPRIVTGIGVLPKQEYVILDDSEVVTSMLTDYMHSSKEMWVASRSAAYLIVDGGRISRKINFASASSDVGIFALPNSGGIFFLNRGGLTGDLLYDSNGNLVWQTPGGNWSRSAAVGDINGDGMAEYIVAVEGRLCAYSQDRALLWCQKNEELVWHIEVGDLDGEGKNSIINSNREGILIIRDREGNIISRIDSLGYIGDFSIISAPVNTKIKYLVASRNAEVVVFNKDGWIVSKFAAPGISSNRIVATYFSGGNGKSPLFAAIVDIRASWKRSKLFVWNEKGSLIYEEILPFAGSSIARINVGSAGEEALLVGGNGRVLKYVDADND